MSLLLVIVSSFMLLNTQAHSPNSVVLSYDFGTQTLEVTVFHTVSDPSHFIVQIQIWKNDIPHTLQTYTSQTSNTQHEDSFNINAINGDVLKVTATCSIAGSSTNQLTVADPAIPEFGTHIPLILLSIIAISGFLIYLKKRK